jgi:hypothetical protein
MLRDAPLLTPAHVTKRLKFAYWWRKHHSSVFKNLKFMFSDEKIFTVNGGMNKQNKRIFAYSREEADTMGGEGHF